MYVWKRVLRALRSLNDLERRGVECRMKLTDGNSESRSQSTSHFMYSSVCLDNNTQAEKYEE